eukprot:gene21145-biopygen20645
MARAWRGRGAGCTPFFGLGGAGVARACPVPPEFPRGIVGRFNPAPPNIVRPCPCPQPSQVGPKFDQKVNWPDNIVLSEKYMDHLFGRSNPNSKNGTDVGTTTICITCEMIDCQQTGNAYFMCIPPPPPTGVQRRGRPWPWPGGNSSSVGESTRQCGVTVWSNNTERQHGATVRIDGMERRYGATVWSDVTVWSDNTERQHGATRSDGIERRYGATVWSDGMDLRVSDENVYLGKMLAQATVLDQVWCDGMERQHFDEGHVALSGARGAWSQGGRGAGGAGQEGVFFHAFPPNESKSGRCPNRGTLLLRRPLVPTAPSPRIPRNNCGKRRGDPPKTVKKSPQLHPGRSMHSLAQNKIS